MQKLQRIRIYICDIPRQKYSHFLNLKIIRLIQNRIYIITLFSRMFYKIFLIVRAVMQAGIDTEIV